MAAQAIGASARTPAYPGGGVPASRRAMERVGGSGCERRLGVHVPSRPWKPTRRWSSKNLQARASGNANWARGIGLPRKRNGDGEDDEDDEVTTMDARSGVYGTQGGGYYDEYGDALTEEERKQAIYAESRRATKKFLDNPITEVSFALLTLVLCLCLAVNTLPLTPLEDAVTSRVEDVIAVIFAWELFARWWIEELKPKFWLGPYTIVDALSLLPPVLGDAYSIAATLRVLRILRLARLLQPKDFNRIVNLITGKDRDLPTYYSKIATVVFTIFCIVFINAGLIYQAEHIGNPQFGTFFDALYFSVTTLTTVGFGDITPITAAGKATVSFSILTGVLLVPTELSALASAILTAVEADKLGGGKKTMCPRCSLEGHAEDSAFCRRCGAELFAGRRQRKGKAGALTVAQTMGTVVIRQEGKEKSKEKVGVRVWDALAGRGQGGGGQQDE